MLRKLSLTALLVALATVANQGVLASTCLCEAQALAGTAGYGCMGTCCSSPDAPTNGFCATGGPNCSPEVGDFPVDAEPFTGPGGPFGVHNKAEFRVDGCTCDFEATCTNGDKCWGIVVSPDSDCFVSHIVYLRSRS